MGVRSAASSALQVLLAVLILKAAVGGFRPGHALFSALAAVVTRFLEFTSVGSEFVQKDG